MIQTAPNMQTQPRIFNKFQLIYVHLRVEALPLCPTRFCCQVRTLPSICSWSDPSAVLFLSAIPMLFGSENNEGKSVHNSWPRYPPCKFPQKGILRPHTSLQSYLHQGCFVYWNPSWILPNRLDMSRVISKKNSINTGNRNAPAVSMDSMDVGCRLDVIGLSISFNWKPRKMRRWKSNPSYDSLNYRNPGVQFSLVDLICMSRILLHLCIFKYISSHVVTTCFIVFPYMQAKNKAASHIFTWKSDLILTAYTIHIHQKKTTTHPPSTKITFSAKPERKAT